MKLETKFYAQVKRNLTEIQWTRLVKDACLKLPKLYEGKDIRELVACGLKQEPLHQGFPDIKKFLYTLGA
jgi:hypothetical protein